MLVSHRKQFIFLKTTKTAGTSVESYFEPYCMPDGEWQQEHSREEYVSEAGIIGYRGPNSKGKQFFNHISASALQAMLPAEVWQEYFKFTIVRDPFDKQISAFHFFALRSNPSINNHKYDDVVQQFRAWLIQTKGIYDGDKYLINGNFVLDDYIKYESLLADLARVGDILGMPFVPERLPNFKSGFRPQNSHAISDYYDQQCLDIVTKRYEFELDKFGYSVPVLAER